MRAIFSYYDAQIVLPRNINCPLMKFFANLFVKAL
jgi:hypothetical protein